MLEKLKNQHAKLDKQQKIAVDITLTAAIVGLIFASIDPNLIFLRRLGRVVVDGIIIFGVLVYLNAPNKIEKTRTHWKVVLRLVERVTLGVFGLGAIAFTLWAPGIDPYLRAYRTSLGIVLLVAMAFDIRRPVPKGFFRGIIGLEASFIIAETLMLVYATWSVDEPIAYAAGKSLIFKTINTLLTTGVTAPSALQGRKVEYGGFVTYRAGKLYGTDSLYDVMHWTNDDPLGMVLIMANAVVERSPRQVIENGLILTDRERCKAYTEMKMPSEGYRIKTDTQMVRNMQAGCSYLSTEKE